MPTAVAEQIQGIRLDPELLATIVELQKSLNGDLTAKVNDAINDAVTALVEEFNDQKLDQEQAAFAAMHAQLVQTHFGQFVAIHQGKLIDADVNQRTLYIRVHQNHPHTVIGIFPVRESSQMPVHHYVGSRKTESV